MNGLMCYILAHILLEYKDFIMNANTSGGSEKTGRRFQKQFSSGSFEKFVQLQGIFQHIASGGANR